MSQEEREEYYRQKAIEIQKGIVNYKTCTTTTSESFIWTYRTTSVDVISTITTNVPVNNGGMKDILMKNREIKRLKVAKKSNKVDLSQSPYDISLSIDKDGKRKRMNNLLLAEQRTFMAKLNASRHSRTELENTAAVRIQTVFRGHFVRANLAEIQHYSEVHKQIRSNIRSYLANKYNLVLSMNKYKRTLTNLRNKSAVVIQCAYFRYLSRKCLRRRRYELWLQKRREAAVRIQAMVRGVSSRSRVKLLVERMRIVLFNKSATLIQAATRRHLARRRVHRRRHRLYCLASRIIINWYRTRYTRKMRAHIRAMLQFRRTQQGATAIQCMVRKFLAKRRVVRIRLRRLHKLIFGYVTAIQGLVRRFICKRRVQRRRLETRAAKEAADAILTQRLAEEAAAAQAAETRQLLDSVDLFLQARNGNTTGVVDIYSGLASTEEHSREEVEAGTGDNLLTIAAATGNLDLVRKCLQWGFDLNHRNGSGFNALMLAAKHNQLSVMQYILAPQVTAIEEGVHYTPLEAISEEDAGFLLVTATANCAVGVGDDLSMLVKVLSLGVDVNAKNAATGMTAAHAACEIGHVEAFKLLAKHKADLEVEDDLGQTPLHKACCSSFKLTEMILGLDPTFHAYMSDATRSAAIQKLDGDGKDCILHAALSGQTDIVDLLTTALQSGGGAAGGSAGSEEIGWSPSDITKALHLVESGNLVCLNKIHEFGFDMSWSEEESGRTLAIAACQAGDVDMIDLLLSYGVDFSVADHSGRTAIHYAAECTTTALLPHLLMHGSAAKCNITDACLLTPDGAGENVYHIAARKGVELKIDLLAQKIQSEALEARNKAGVTPILLACTLFKLDIIRLYMKLGADPLVQDADGHGCLWHLLHPGPDIPRRPLCSEFMLHPSVASSSVPALSRREKDEEIARVASELTLVIAFLRAGCLLYADAHSPCPPESLATELEFKWNEAPTSASRSRFQCGDVLVQELSLTLLKAIIQDGLLRTYDAWRLLLASFWFDDGSQKAATALFKAGIIDAMSIVGSLAGASEQETTTSGSAAAVNVVGSLTAGAGAGVGAVTAAAPATRRMSVAEIAYAQSSDTMPLQRLQEQYFNDFTVLGWAMKLGRPKVLQFFMRRGYKVTTPVDTAGNAAMHLAAICGTAEMVELLLIDKSIILEQKNRAGWTAGMLAARHRNFPVFRKLFEVRADMRRCLDGAYAAWVLAFVRRRERNEVNTQTGRYGDDDVRYFDISPDPFYITWYAL